MITRTGLRIAVMVRMPTKTVNLTPDIDLSGI